jgi:hypothetical protein
MNVKSEIRKTEEAIEKLLDKLERNTGIRAFRMQVLSQRGDDASITITPDEKGGRY